MWGNRDNSSFMKVGDFDHVWNCHLADVNIRKAYASAMIKLATEVWNDKESRIHWSYKTCIDYFLNDGIKHSLLRELKIQRKWSPSFGEDIEYLCHLSEEKNNYKNFDRKLQLLDVGSCYNPFSKFPIFECLAIDITPATKDVVQCDFLKLKVLHENDDACNHADLRILYESIDIVVFSLVLEYLPAREQRFKFCLKAWDVLRKNGLLIIITPDSKSLQHNAPMMKSWKKCLEHIGFFRFKYEKLTHLHCMAFRKTNRILDSSFCLQSLSELMFIPQDFKKYELSKTYTERAEHENLNVIQQFSVLPSDYSFENQG
nr:S-adenosylmethionine sensor upstream of mTORC1 isoform X2 [Parasteatoda tepidariorum]